MPAYVVFMRDKTLDPTELAKYSTDVDASFDGHNVEFLADYGAIETLEGPQIEGAVVLRFPDISSARAWYRSPRYQAIAQHRFQGATYRGFIVDGY